MTRNLRRFFSLPLLPFVTTLVAGAWAGGMDHNGAAAVIAIVFFSLLTVGVARKWLGLPWKSLLAVAGCFAVSFFSVYTLLHPILPKNHVANFSGRKTWIVEGRILPPLDPGLDHSQVTVAVEAMLTHNQRRYPACGKLRVSVRGPYTQTVYVGDTVRFVSRVARPRPSANPFAFDYRRFLALRRIYATARVSGFSQFVVMQRDSRFAWRNVVNQLRQRLNRWITASIPAPYNALAAAFLIGYRGQISPEMREIFIRCGAAHLIAISGLHLGIVSILLFLIIRRLLAFFPRIFLYTDIHRITAVLTFLGLLFYLVLTGGRVSTVRAFIMAAAFLAVLFFRRTSRLPDILVLAAFVILFFQPQAIFFVSFQLTFAAVGGILLGINRSEYERFEAEEKKAKKWVGKLLLWLGATLLVTILAMAATFPIATYHFHRASPMALVANLFGIPYVGFVMLPMGLIGLIAYPFSTGLATFLLRIDGFLIAGLVRYFRFLAGLPHSRVTIFPLRWHEIALYYGAFVFTVLALRSKHRLYRRRYAFGATACAGALLVSIFVSPAVRFPSVTAFSVRKGVYLAAIGRNGHATVVCHGLGDFPRRDDAHWVLLPYLLNRRVRALDAVVVGNNTPVNLRAVAGLLRYKTPRYLIGTQSALYSLKTVCPMADSNVTWVETPQPLRVGNEIIHRGRDKRGFVSLSFEGLHFLVELSRKRRKAEPEKGRMDVLLAPTGFTGVASQVLPWVIRYPAEFYWREKKVRGPRMFDLRRDGAVTLEKIRGTWRARTFLSHREVSIK